MIDPLSFSLYYDRHGKPMSRDAWAKAVMAQRHVAKTKLWFGLVRISTVWLGIDHSFLPGSRPVIFESMVFFGRSWSQRDLRRYGTEEDALQGHYELVVKYRRPWNVLRALRP